jgi:hypothetical protein
MQFNCSKTLFTSHVHADASTLGKTQSQSKCPRPIEASSASAPALGNHTSLTPLTTLVCSAFCLCKLLAHFEGSSCLILAQPGVELPSGARADSLLIRVVKDCRFERGPLAVRDPTLPSLGPLFP